MLVDDEVLELEEELLEEELLEEELLEEELEVVVEVLKQNHAKHKAENDDLISTISRLALGCKLAYPFTLSLTAYRNATRNKV